MFFITKDENNLYDAALLGAIKPNKKPKSSFIRKFITIVKLCKSTNWRDFSFFFSEVSHHLFYENLHSLCFTFNCGTSKTLTENCIVYFFHFNSKTGSNP